MSVQVAPHPMSHVFLVLVRWGIRRQDFRQGWGFVGMQGLVVLQFDTTDTITIVYKWFYAPLEYSSCNIL